MYFYLNFFDSLILVCLSIIIVICVSRTISDYAYLLMLFSNIHLLLARDLFGSISITASSRFCIIVDLGLVCLVCFVAIFVSSSSIVTVGSISILIFIIIWSPMTPHAHFPLSNHVLIDSIS